MVKKDWDSKVRESIQASMDQAAKVHSREMYKKRLEMARHGISHAQAGKVKDALLSFRSYLVLLSESKKCTEDQLNPSLFDIREDAPELLLINAVFWELCKIYDKAKSKKGPNMELMKYLDKYVIFSKGMSYEPVSAETLRKFIANNKAFHKSEFKAAYKRLGGSSCFVVTSLVDYVGLETLNEMRVFRDETLSRFRLGRLFTNWYYGHGSHIADWMDRQPEWVRKYSAYLITRFARFISK